MITTIILDKANWETIVIGSSKGVFPPWRVLTFERPSGQALCPPCRPSPAEIAARWTNGWSGEAAPQRSATRRTAGLGRELRHWFGRHVIQGCTAPDGREEPIVPHAAARTKARYPVHSRHLRAAFLSAR